EIGFNAEGFSYDNEGPSHQTFVQDFLLQNRLVTNREYLDFIEDRGYQDFRHWLSEGWDTVQREGWIAPLYWKNIDNEWHEATLSGFRKISLDAPVCHISFYEAEAFASWSKKRLPTEAEWEVAAHRSNPISKDGNFLEKEYFHPIPNKSDKQNKISQLLGDVWEWTQSSYLPYPGYRHTDDALGEYNGKFMVNQMVLRGGSCATPESHIRITYRNFFHPDRRWQFTGIRLADNP
ncbi:MAG: ergothioneine biosynthesis protein EgtB, partial [Chlorobiales bacterium]|nr:ergothioneine biosynthesis protein EgtB [Chlorobiales bacterium]